MEHVEIAPGLTLYEDGTWMRSDDLPVKISKMDWRERIYYKGKQYFTHWELAKKFVPNPNKYETVELIDPLEDISANNIRWIKHPGMKITQQRANSIKAMVKEGRSQRYVAKYYGVSPSMVSRIMKGERW